MKCILSNKLRKFLASFVACVFLVNSSICVFAQGLPELPNLPEFDTVVAPDGLDVFAPSETPPEIAPAKPVQVTPKQSVSKNQQTNAHHVPQKIIVMIVQKQQINVLHVQMDIIQQELFVKNAKKLQVV